MYLMDGSRRTGREGCPPLGFVFTGKTAAQRESRMRLLERAGADATSNGETETS
jgi:hypothetical protein